VKRLNQAVIAGLAASLLFGTRTGLAKTSDDDTAEYHASLSTQHEIWQDFTGYGQFQYYNNPQENYETYDILYPGVIYRAKDWLQFSGGMEVLDTENMDKADTVELRPFAAVKVFLPNKWKWNFYNYDRYEYCDTQNQDTYVWSEYSRLRMRFGVDAPLTSLENAWQPHTFYAMGYVEPVFRFDSDQINPLYLDAGVGYIINHRLRLELIYQDEFTRPGTGSSLHQTYNVFELNLKVDLGKGILERLHNPD